MAKSRGKEKEKEICGVVKCTNWFSPVWRHEQSTQDSEDTKPRSQQPAEKIAYL